MLLLLLELGLLILLMVTSMRNVTAAAAHVATNTKQNNIITSKLHVGSAWLQSSPATNIDMRNNLLSLSLSLSLSLIRLCFFRRM